MVRIAPIGLQYNPRTLWFDPNGLEINKGNAVVVKTERGTEYGHATDDIIEVSEEAIKKLKSALKPVLRLATEEDDARASELEEKARMALPLFRELAVGINDDMHPVMVEYLFDGDKAIFYFSAEERVDFRELVRKLAAQFHVRVDMRQIGVRDEARIVGGLGHCGQELCCKRLGGEFCPVSIRMAKEQDLSLNPQKISGVCGRLMCCLRYEFDAYKDFKGRAPKVGAKVDTPKGSAKVIDLNVPREIVSLKMEDAKIVKIPLAEMDPPEEGVARPSVVGEEAFERATADQGLIGDTSASMIFATPNFTGTDKLAEGGARTVKARSPRKGGDEEGKNKTNQPATEGRKPRRRNRGGNGGGNANGAGAQGAATASNKNPRNAQGQSGQESRSATSKQRSPRQRSGQGTQNGSGETRNTTGKQTVRPGQNSSGLRNTASKSRRGTGGGVNGKKNPGTSSQKPSNASSVAPDTHRKTRRRSHKTGGAGSEA
ncbi:MAG: regulatory iron-sulfur-containing complex subunit RicT [Raoultibacter sp.]